MGAEVTNQEINERVAKLCGWVASVETIEHNIGYQWTENRKVWSFPGRGRHLRPTNYAESLDACRSFERTLDTTESTEYAVHLRRIVTRNTTDADKHPDTGYVPDGRYYCAAPIERCEAFLRLKGQWE